MKKAIYFLIIMIFGLFSCKGKEDKSKEQTDYFFSIPELDLRITTSKRIGAKFYVMFSKQDNAVILSDSVDYIECETMDSDINIILNPEQKDNICFLYPNVKKVNQVKYALHRIDSQEYRSIFFEKQVRTQPLILKEPYIHISIIPSTYTIILHHASSNQERIKEGNIYGGW
jgi:hypothetical protein